MPSRRNTNRSNKDKILNVRIADSAAGGDGLHVDRQIAAIKESESQTRILIGSIFDAASEVSPSNGTVGFEQIYESDDFVSLIQQYNLFRVSAIKFDIYDIDGTRPAFNNWGIWHDNYELTPPAYTRTNVADLPDSRVISPGTGQTTLYWVAHGTAEKQFQQASNLGSVAQKFGGLKYFIGDSTVRFSKYTIQMHAIVDFRGRR